METSYTKWDNSVKMNDLMEGQNKAQESKDFNISEFIKRKVVIYCVILGIGFLLITALLSLSLRNESKMSKAIEMKNTRSSDSLQMLSNLSKEVPAIGRKVDLLQAGPREDSAEKLAELGRENNTVPKYVKQELEKLQKLTEEVAKLREENRRVGENATRVLEELHNLIATQMTKENLIPSLIEEVATLREENRRIAEGATRMLEELHNLTEFFCTTCPPKWIPFQKNCYFFSTLIKPWMVAKQSCENEGAHLVIMNSYQEMKFLISQALTDQAFWMGLNDAGKEGHWLWVDGTPLDFSSWAKGEPNNSGNREDCAMLLFNGKWNDAYCTRNELWICERKC